ncbi:hypothetical protein KUIN1_32070 [Pseudomonas sp. KUIN-1]|nr:hypothetical protein KUIN1_32070 [Pseudomonas sp. KUIN-1]
MNGIATLEPEEREVLARTLSYPCSAWVCISGRSASSSEQAAPYDKCIASALAWIATSVTAVLSHHMPRNGGPMANRRAEY